MGQPLKPTGTDKGIWTRGDKFVVIVRGRKHTCANITEARRLQTRLKAKAQEGVPSGKTTLSAYYEDTWFPMIEQTLAKPTVRLYEIAMRVHVLPVLGSTRLTDLRSPEVKRLRDKLSRTLARETVKTTLAPLKSMLNAAWEDGLISENVAAPVKAPALPRDRDKKRPPTFTEAELARFLTVVDPRWTTFFRLLASSGMRISEAVALQYHDVLSDRLIIRRRFSAYDMDVPKSGKSRVIPITPAMYDALVAHRAGSFFNGDEDFVFPNLLGRPTHVRDLQRKVLDPAFIKAGIAVIPRCAFHRFRHTFATNALKHMPLEDVSRILGHSSTAVTEARYIHHHDDDLPSVAWTDVAPSLPRLHVVEPEPRNEAA